MPDIIETPRIRLRPVTEQDTPEIFRYASDPKWAQHVCGLPWPYTTQDAANYVEFLTRADRQLSPSWGMEIAGHIRGVIALRFSDDHRITELAYGLERPLWNKGLTTEAARALIKTAMIVYPQLHRVWLKIQVGNEASHRVAGKLGMCLDGILRADLFDRGEFHDRAYYSILRPELYLM